MTKTFILFTALLLLTSCSNSSKKIVGENAKTMKQIQEEKFGVITDTTKTQQNRRLGNGDMDLRGQIRDEFQKLYGEFQYLPNPVMIMYIYPHLTDAGTPVPGYVTFFKFYKQDQFALPHEIIPDG